MDLTNLIRTSVTYSGSCLRVGLVAPTVRHLHVSSPRRRWARLCSTLLYSSPLLMINPKTLAKSFCLGPRSHVLNRNPGVYSEQQCCLKMPYQAYIRRKSVQGSRGIRSNLIFLNLHVRTPQLLHRCGSPPRSDRLGKEFDLIQHLKGQ